MCPYELALKLHELGVNSESEFYFVKEVKGGGSKTESIAQNTMRYSYRKEGDLIPAYMSHELGEIEAMGMMSENIERANRGESLAYTEDQFMRLIQDNGITYNDVIQRGWI